MKVDQRVKDDCDHDHKRIGSLMMTISSHPDDDHDYDESAIASLLPVQRNVQQGFSSFFLFLFLSLYLLGADSICCVFYIAQDAAAAAEGGGGAEEAGGGGGGQGLRRLCG